jgi:hypothetical protein
MMAMAHARNRLAVNDGRLSLKQGSFEKLPVNDASMDGILAVNVLYFVEPLYATQFVTQYFCLAILCRRSALTCGA